MRHKRNNEKNGRLTSKRVKAERFKIVSGGMVNKNKVRKQLRGFGKARIDINNQFVL